ncbi:MAG: hypothetical protein MZU97_20260 [Bacillus subtilis]|nr:hypothetical protein [Bacillus subtilis]
MKRNSTKQTVAVWDLQFPEPAEPEDSEIASLAATVDRLLVRLKDTPVEAAFRTKGERIKQYIIKHKFAGATQTVTLLQ